MATGGGEGNTASHRWTEITVSHGVNYVLGI